WGQARERGRAQERASAAVRQVATPCRHIGGTTTGKPQPGKPPQGEELFATSGHPFGNCLSMGVAPCGGKLSRRSAALLTYVVARPARSGRLHREGKVRHRIAS